MPRSQVPDGDTLEAACFVGAGGGPQTRPLKIDRAYPKVLRRVSGYKPG